MKVSVIKTIGITLILLITFVALVHSYSKNKSRHRLLIGGRYVHKSKVIWGYVQHNGWWRAGQRPNITRNAGNDIRPNRTENLDLLTDSMLRYGYPGFEHNFGLCYDRRRDRHDTVRRKDANVVGPFLESPWARSGHGTAWDGLSKYDLTVYNQWYFDRLKAFADLCDKKGTILLHNFYMQHAIEEMQTHYADFPWRPVNCIQQTGLPDILPAANTFYDTTNPVRKKLHRSYIRKCLEVLGNNRNVVHLLSEEYTGPVNFMRFWLEVVKEWEQETGRDVHIALGATKEVQEEILADNRLEPLVSSLDLRYWWYRKNGTLNAPEGGKNGSGRYADGFEIAKTTPWQMYRQVLEMRHAYPEKGIIHCIDANRQQTWAVLMAGGSLIVRHIEYENKSDPPEYIAPEQSAIIQTTYDFINTHLVHCLHEMYPSQLVLDRPQENWCLATEDRSVLLVYALTGGEFRLDLRSIGKRVYLHKPGLTVKLFCPR